MAFQFGPFSKGFCVTYNSSSQFVKPLLSMGKKLIAVITSTGISHGQKEMFTEGFGFSVLATGWFTLFFTFIFAFLVIHSVTTCLLQNKFKICRHLGSHLICYLRILFRFYPVAQPIIANRTIHIVFTLGADVNSCCKYRKRLAIFLKCIHQDERFVIPGPMIIRF